VSVFHADAEAKSRGFDAVTALTPKSGRRRRTREL
jgi:hypothetical protein